MSVEEEQLMKLAVAKIKADEYTRQFNEQLSKIIDIEIPMKVC